jgi:hypothetical protein
MTLAKRLASLEERSHAVAQDRDQAEREAEEEAERWRRDALPLADFYVEYAECWGVDPGPAFAPAIEALRQAEAEFGRNSSDIWGPQQEVSKLINDARDAILLDPVRLAALKARLDERERRKAEGLKP